MRPHNQSSQGLPKMKLTETAVAAITLDPRQDEAITFDEDIPGFGLRLRAGGSRTFVFQYKIGGKHRRMTLGKHPALKTAEARKTAANRDSPDESQTGINVRVFPALLQDRREVLTATSTSDNPNAWSRV